LSEKQFDQLEYLAIQVVNTGDKLANINHVGWETGRFRNKKFFLLTGFSPAFDDLPKILLGGYKASFMVPLYLPGDSENWLVGFSKTLAGDQGSIDNIKRLKVVIGTTVGKDFKVSIEKELKDKLLELYRETTTN